MLRYQPNCPFEQVLAERAPQERLAKGVFYTPDSLCRVVVQRVDEILRSDFAMPLGLADQGSAANQSVGKLKFLEPSAGSGAFLCAILRQQLTNIRQANPGPAQFRKAAKVFLRDLSHRLHAIECMPEAISLANSNIRECLSRHGLSEVEIPFRFITGDGLSQETHQALGGPATVILGNPPYRAASENGSPWIRELLRGRSDDGRRYRSYFEVDGQPLGERKAWLHDDYVKFLRVAHWHIERTGYGIIGFVLNHGFIDNATFRGLRFQLWNEFDRIEILDLGGNRKRQGTSAAVHEDEAVFAASQGVALVVLSRSPKAVGRCAIRFGRLRGNREFKLRTLSGTPWDQLLDQAIVPRSPRFTFSPSRMVDATEYGRGIPITDLFPRSCSAVVTARDKLVIDRNRDELLRRIGTLRDPEQSNEELRTAFFPKPRGSRYAPGDTRSWKLGEAREKLQQHAGWRDRVRLCLYRPFDCRWIYWSPDMIDWPRGEIMEQMLQPNSLALVVRRQMPPEQPCNFFYIADRPVIDGVLRSDNRGNETIVPLLARGVPNLSVELLPSYLQAEWHKNNAVKRIQMACMVMAYCYGVFHGEEYRIRYAEQLRNDFPRVSFPVDRAKTLKMANYGHQLIHVQLTATADPGKAKMDTSPAEIINRKFPIWRNGKVFISAERFVASASREAWEFHLGGHQVLGKWLKDRRSGIHSYELTNYTRVVAAVEKTLEVTRNLNAWIRQAGGIEVFFGRGA